MTTSQRVIKPLGRAVVRLGAFGLAVAGAGGAGAGIAAALDPTTQNFLQGLGAHFGKYCPALLSDGALDAFQWRDPDAKVRDILQNHDLQRLEGRAMGLCLRGLCRDGTGQLSTQQRGLLQKVADKIPQSWPRLAEIPGLARDLLPEDLEPLQPQQLSELLKAFQAEAPDPEARAQQPSPVERDIWRKVLEHAAGQARVWSRNPVRRKRLKGFLEDGTLDTAAQHLERCFSFAFHELLKDDFAKPQGGSAYAALQLQVFGTLLKNQDQLLQLASKSMDNWTEEAARKLPELLQEAVKSSFDELDQASRDRHQSLIQRLNQMDATLQLVQEEAQLRLVLDPLKSQAEARGAQALQARARKLELLGQEERMAGLRLWLGGAEAVAIRRISGPAGAGKSRLALELCDRAREGGWEAGFAGRQTLRQFLQERQTARWRRFQPTLVVVDYAGTRVEDLKSLLEALAENQQALEGTPALRLLLVDRAAARNGAPAARGGSATQLGLDELLKPGLNSLGAALEHWHKPDGDLALPPFEQELARELLVKALGGLGQSDSGQEAATLLQAMEKMRLPRTPLHLQIAALLHQEIGNGALTRWELLAMYWRREREEYLRPLAQEHEVDPELLERLVVAGSLRGGIPSKELETLVEEEVERGGRTPPARRGVEKALASYPGKREDVFAPLEPDLLAEQALLATLRTLNQQDRGDSWLQRHLKAAPEAALPFMVRAA